jgi:hypothetical protein
MSATSGTMLVNNPAANMQLERRLKNLRAGSVDVDKLFTERERSDKIALIAALERRLLQDHLTPKQRQALRDFLDSKSDLNDRTIQSAIRLVMSTPEYQLT